MNAPEDKWKEDRKAEAENMKTYNRLWLKAGFDGGRAGWSEKELKNQLKTWEYYFLLASMFEGVANNGGLVHGFHCYFDGDESSGHYVPVEDMLDCWRAIGCKSLIKAHEVGQHELKRFGVTNYEDLDLKREEELEDVLDKALAEVDDGEPFEIRLADYARRNEAAGEQAGAQSP